MPAGPVATAAMPGDGVNNIWPFPFAVADASEVEVVFTPAGGSGTTLDSGSYTVQLGVDGDDGGRVIYPVGTGRVGPGDTITVLINPRFDQPTDLKSQGDYSPESVEDALDHLERQILRTRSEQGQTLRVPLGYTIQAEIGPPVVGATLKWALLASGAYQLQSATADGASLGTPAAIRVLYADDLGLKGDGTDETAAINAALLAYDGKPVLIFLQAAVGYWPISGGIFNRSSIQLSWGSPLRLGRDGFLAMAGDVALQATAATVTTATAAGATVIPCTALVGGLSASFAAGDQVDVGGQRLRVTAVDDGAGTLTVASATTADLAAGAAVRRLVASYATASWTRADTPREIAVADTTVFQVGDVVWVTDDEVATRLDGLATATVNSELARVTGFGAGTVRLDRSIKHAMSTANRARVVKVEPCRNASISGATVVFTEAPDADRIDTFLMDHAYQCEVAGCRVPNEDMFGSRGQAFRVRRCLDCRVIDCGSGPAKYTGTGEGYGVNLIESSACEVVRFRGVGARDVCVFTASTDCTVRDLEGSNWFDSLVVWQGIKEIGCWVDGFRGVGGGLGGQSGLCAGRAVWAAGCWECGARNGTITDVDGVNAAGISLQVPTDQFLVEGVVVRRAFQGLYASDYQGNPSLEIGKVRIRVDFHDCATAALVDMNAFGSTAKPFNLLDLRGSRFFECVDGLLIDNCDEVDASDIVFETSVHGSGKYATNIQAVTLARVGGRFAGCQKHFTFKDTSFRLESYSVVNPQTTTLLDETSTSGASNCRDAYGRFPAGWTPARTSAVTTVTVLSLPGMT